MMKNENN